MWVTQCFASFPLSREGRGQRLFRCARDFAPADIAAAETAGEVELVDRGIGVRLRLGYGAPRRGDVEHAPARRDDPAVAARRARMEDRSEEHTSELQSLMRNSYAVFRLKKKTTQRHHCPSTRASN